MPVISLPEIWKASGYKLKPFESYLNLAALNAEAHRNLEFGEDALTEW